MATFPTFSRDVEWEMEESIEDSSVKTTLDSGHVHGRSKFTRDRKIWNGVTCRNLNAADRILYLAFLAEIRGTATTFTWKSPIDDIDYVVRFLQVPALSRLLPGYYQLSFGVMEE